MSLEAITRTIRERLTPADIKKIAEAGNLVFAKTPRFENFAGLCLSVSGQLIHRTADYEVVRFEEDEPCADVLARCESAIAKLGARIEGCLHGHRSGKVFHVALEGGNPTSDAGMAAGAMIYSLGPVPRLLESDGLAVHVRDGTYQVRFGYYAEAGPLHSCKDFGHWLSVNRQRDFVECIACDLAISGEQLCAMDIHIGGSRYDKRSQELADKASAAEREVVQLKIENSDLHRKVERLERKGSVLREHI